MNWNINSLAKDEFSRVKLLEIENSVFDYDIISLCETSLNNEITVPQNEYFNNNYTFIAANKPDNTRHGGVGLFYRNDLPVIVRRDISFDECLVIELKFGRKKIFFTVLYRSPAFKATTPEFANFLTNFTNLYANIKNENPYMCFFTGDFNAHSQIWYPDGKTTQEGKEIEDMISRLGLHQIIREPTNIQPDKNKTCIDLIMTDQPNLVLESGTHPSPDQHCHHQILYCKSNVALPPPPPYERELWYYQRANKDLIQRSMANFQWEEHLNQNSDPNWQVKEFSRILLNIMSNFIPHETKKILPRDSPWITKPLKAMIKRKNRLYKNYKKHGYKEQDKVRLDNFRLECQNAVEAAKNSYIRELGNKLHNQRTSEKTYWKIIDKVLNKSKAPRIPPLLVENQFIFNCKEKAILFTKFFCEQCTPFTSNSVLPALNYKTIERIDQVIIEVEDITTIIRKLNPNKATGPDGITSQMLLLCDETIAQPLQIIFKTILSTGIYPENWKRSNVTPIHKKNSKQLISNYRPISLLPICGKVFEKIVFNQLYSYLTRNNLITNKQSGFRPNDSTTNQLLDLVDTIHQSFDANNPLEVRAVFLDLSKAFDKVWHEGILFKLKQNGVSGKLLDLFASYLNNRKQRVVLNGSTADYEDVKSGVPQGSVLGPLLFLIYINDLEDNIKSQIRFFADDTMLFSIVKDPNISANDLNQDLETIQQWATQWKMKFNPDPSKPATELLFSVKRNSPDHPPLYFNGKVIKEVDEHKHLGVILDSKLSFKSHINDKINKTKKIIGTIKNLSKYFPLKTLILMYKSLVRPHFDYCDIIYHIPPSNNGIFGRRNESEPTDENESLNELMKTIERVQYQAALAISGTWQSTSKSKLYTELGLESLSDRRSSNRVLKMFKLLNNHSPENLREKLPHYRIPRGRNANPNLLYEIMPRTDRYKCSYFPNAITSWNKVIRHLEGNVTYHKLKSFLLKSTRPNPKDIYNIHDPIGLHYLFQIRTGLSPLNSHKFNRNFQDTPSDTCICNQDAEDTKHFLFDCLLFANSRVTLAVDVTNILIRENQLELANNVELYLYGNSKLSKASNKQILLSTIKYIKETKRFSS